MTGELPVPVAEFWMGLIPVRTINGAKHMIEVTEESIISEVKEKLSEITGHPAEKWQLLFKGKQLDDSLLVNTLRIGDGFLIAVKKKTTNVQNPAKVEKPKAVPVDEKEEKQEAPKPLEPPKPTTTIVPPPEQPSEQPLPDFSTIHNDVSPLEAEKNEKDIAFIMELGYEREDAEDAYRLVQFDRDLAIEVLLNGRLDDLRMRSAAHQQLTSMLGNPAFVEEVQRNPELLNDLGFVIIPYDDDEEDDDEEDAPGVVITPEEEECIRRLMELSGKDHETVVELFVACERNENLTANALLDDK